MKSKKTDWSVRKSALTKLDNYLKQKETENKRRGRRDNKSEVLQP